MKKIVFLWQTAGFVFTSIVGTLLHFAYDWSNESILIAPFVAVNESIWEHTKLLFVPLLIFALIEYRSWGHEKSGFWCAKLIGIITGITVIPALYYTYTGALGVFADWFNITIFFISTLIVFVLETHLLNNKNICFISENISFAAIVIIGVIYIVFTFYPPHFPLFEDPLSRTYGHLNSV